MGPHPLQPAPIAKATSPLDECALGRRRFLAAIEAVVPEARAYGRRFGVYLITVGLARELDASITPEERQGLVARTHLRLAHCVEPDCTIAQLRPDTFGLLLPRIRNGLWARETAARILGTLGYPMRASIGIAVFPCDGRQASELLGCAAWALAVARRRGPATYRFYLRALATSAASSSPLL